MALLAFIFVYETLVHGFLLSTLYSTTPTLWRPFSQMQAYMPFNIGIMIALSLWITFIFTRFFKEGGLSKGICFGFYLGILSGLQAAGAYYYLPISWKLAAAWFVFGMIESTLGGALIGGLYKHNRQFK
jgi:hypothetical protein